MGGAYLESLCKFEELISIINNNKNNDKNNTFEESWRDSYVEFTQVCEVYIFDQFCWINIIEVSDKMIDCMLKLLKIYTAAGMPKWN